MRTDLAPIGVAIALVGGTRFGEALGPGSGVLGVLVVVAALGASLAVAPRRRRRAALAVVAAVAIGATVMQRALDGAAHSSLTSAVQARTLVAARGTLVADPAASRFGTDALVRVDRWRAVDGPEARAAPRDAHRIVVVRAAPTDRSRLAQLEAGDAVAVTGRLAPLDGPHDTMARWSHAVAQLRSVTVDDWSAPHEPLLQVADGLRDRVLGGLRALPPRDRTLLGAFLLGDTRALDDQVRTDFRAAGLSHLLVVSGANVAFVLAVFGPVRRRLPIGGRAALGLGVVVVFATMTRFEPSVLRASVMAALVMVAGAFGRPVRSLRALALAVCVLVVADPFLVHSLGFWLSVGATAGIALLAPAIAKVLPGARVVRETIAVSVAAQAGVLPVLVVSGVGLPWVAPAANLLAVPVAEPISVLALPAAALAPSRALGAPLLHASAVLLTWVRSVAHTARVAPTLVWLGATALAVGASIAEACLRRSRPASEAPDAHR